MHNYSSPKKSKTLYGFTLIEILIVIFIISIAATFAVINLGNITHTRRIEEVAKELAYLLPTAENQAILQPAVIGLRINKNNYQFFQYIIDQKNQTTHWESLVNDRVFTSRIIPPDVAVNLTTPEKYALTSTEKKTTQPQLIFLPSGDISPFNIIIGGKDEPAKYQLIGASNGEIKLIKLEPAKQ